MHWQILTEESQVEARINDLTFDKPCVIFKHSTSCPISSIAKSRLEDMTNIESEGFHAFYLDLLTYRHVSHAVAELLQVHHESPQVILVVNGEVKYDESHLDISRQELLEQVLEND